MPLAKSSSLELKPIASHHRPSDAALFPTLFLAALVDAFKFLRMPMGVPRMRLASKKTKIWSADHIVVLLYEPQFDPTTK